MSGYEKLKKYVLNNVEEYGGTFNPNGCNKCGAKCWHNYCDKFKWVIDRAKNYGKATNIPWEHILDKWEEDRNYWYMNYYQESKQPEMKENHKIRIFETKKDFWESVGDKGFRCPACKGISSDPWNCDSGEKIKGKNSRICNWTAGGLFGTLGEGTTIFIKEICVPVTIFTPIAWEKGEK